MACEFCVGDSRLKTWPDYISYIDGGRIFFEDVRWSGVRSFPILFCPMCGERIAQKTIDNMQ